MIDDGKINDRPKGKKSQTNSQPIKVLTQIPENKEMVEDPINKSDYQKWRNKQEHFLISVFDMLFLLNIYALSI